MHEAFSAQVSVARLGDDSGDRSIRFVAEINVTCTGCELPFHFVGPPAGFSFTHPTVNVGATTLHAPIAPGEAQLPRTLRFEVA
jgi:hypothetical protein